ncbi:Mu-like prophage major head subunit gpT family protein [Limimaricola variabilis]|uniref:Mu-like prophage major head subunit gpT family protein n=1 Tax=Limimaricola variabilis TaxID=1492771 RepID=UPI002AC8BA5E|nr:Mu-like prophage major head subunit gpT family protein [Limimaricola variabilis]WPY94681.1 Mu-like prophage major head subunit gpT family protein [Limimaricola variabilis]
MIISQTSLAALRVGFSAAFRAGLDVAASDYKKIAFTVPSSTKETTYGWLGKLPRLREWVGPRVIQNIAEHSYTIVNKDFEETIGVDRNDIEDDNLGIYTPLMQTLGEAVGALPDELVFGALKNGFTTECYDGQNFFDTDHPVIQEDGSIGTVSNTGGGAGAPWFLLCTGAPLKPIIYQERRPFDFVSKDKATDDNVFNNRQYLYGTDGRCNVGYGFWQMAYGSRQVLDADSYAAARAAVRGMKGDHGRPLGLKPNLLVVPTALEAKALEILNAERNAAGATNVWKGTAELLVTSWLD